MNEYGAVGSEPIALIGQKSATIANNQMDIFAFHLNGQNHWATTNRWPNHPVNRHLVCEPAFVGRHSAYWQDLRRIDLATAGLGDPYDGGRELERHIYYFSSNHLW